MLPLHTADGHLVEGAARQISEERFRLVFAESPVGIVLAGLDGRYLRANPAFCRMLGWSERELQELTFHETTHPDDRAGDAELVARLSRGEISTHHLEKRLLRKAGGAVEVALRVSVVRDGEGHPLHLLAQVEDVTGKRRAVDGGRRGDDQCRTLIELAPDGIGVTDAGGCYVEANAALCRMLGYSRAELVGRAVADMLPAGDLPRLAAVRAEIEVPGVVEIGEWEIRRKDGTWLPVEVSVIRLPDGRRQAFVRDIQQRKRLERLREEWISVVAHDLQQPVAAIRLYASLLEGLAAREPEASEPVARIGEIARGLNRMIADLLDLSRAEIGELPLQRRPVDLADLARAAVERLAVEAASPACAGSSPPPAPDGDPRRGAPAGRAVGIEVRGPIPVVSADPDRIGQVLDNLLTNAVKYGTPGTPIVVAVEAGEGAVSVAVTNQGPGIPEAELPRLFRRFERGGTAPDGVKGAGLGLHIARQLCEAHGGRLGAQSVPGGTTTFRFTLPAGTRA